MYNILICDDEKDIVSALSIYLSTENYNIFTAYTGQEALDIVAKHDIHLILMDIMMPQMDGIAATVKLRETSNIPIILLTAKSEDSDKILGLNIGADDYITKPFNPIEVLARVRSQLRRYTSLGGMAKKASHLTNGGGLFPFPFGAGQRWAGRAAEIFRYFHLPDHSPLYWYDQPVPENPPTEKHSAEGYLLCAVLDGYAGYLG